MNDKGSLPDHFDSRFVDRAEVERVLAWVEEQRSYCRPDEYADLSAEELDERRGACAAYGAVVYGLVARKLEKVLSGDQDGICPFCANETTDNCETAEDRAVCALAPLPPGFRWEYRTGFDGGGNISDGRLEVWPCTKYRRAVGPWLVDQPGGRDHALVTERTAP